MASPDSARRSHTVVVKLKSDLASGTDATQGEDKTTPVKYTSFDAVQKSGMYTVHLLHKPYTQRSGSGRSVISTVTASPLQAILKTPFAPVALRKDDTCSSLTLVNETLQKLDGQIDSVTLKVTPGSYQPVSTKALTPDRVKMPPPPLPHVAALYVEVIGSYKSAQLVHRPPTREQSTVR